MNDSSNISESYPFMQFIQAIKNKAGDETVDVFEFNEHGAADIATSKGYVTLWLAKKDRNLCGQHPADLSDTIQVGKVIEDGKVAWIAYTGGIQRQGSRTL